MSPRANRRKYKLKPRFFVIIGRLALIVVLFAACHLKGSDGSKGGKEDKEKAAKEQVVDVKVVTAGDIIGHSPMVNAAMTNDGGYDFTPSFRYVKKYIEGADRKSVV